MEDAEGIELQITGQSAATLLGGLYYDKGGNSKWMATFVQSAGFPILLPLLFFFPSSINSNTATNPISSSFANKPEDDAKSKTSLTSETEVAGAQLETG
ncbi:purine permease 21-like isoform X3 [Populus alba x Populus x berolinensis]|uniref:Purine permease 21-like isoform X3 n=1 Tax=Populus alba x Populus x berolinensis TaxID=444605 RepID=A0AAD6RLM6_9ROSI|nr:purine permease 21-like isoform X3 [Populus alba x Populus x berolinensis]